MKRLLSFALASIMLVIPSCVPMGNLDQMDDASFATAVNNVEQMSIIGSVALKPRLKEKTRTVLLNLIGEVKTAMQGQPTTLPTSLAMIVDYFADQLARQGVSVEEIALIKACVMLVDNSLGGVRLGVDGIGSERTQQVVLALARGLESGLK